jgi:hypothetical protein
MGAATATAASNTLAVASSSAFATGCLAQLPGSCIMNGTTLLNAPYHGVCLSLRWLLLPAFFLLLPLLSVAACRALGVFSISCKLTVLSVLLAVTSAAFGAPIKLLTLRAVQLLLLRGGLVAGALWKLRPLLGRLF